ncbi:RidA family protein [Lichenihabitans psoromatis]|uniref:RidA family protein n=1 Tax=Lichenihabitans psoromatis TaxID=2528642 RepID=UPI0010383F50|nr:RidA family protein [Lichenihabitans psoromatis]
MSVIDQKLASLGIVLPVPVAPIANYVPFVLIGRSLYISGQLAIGQDGKLSDAHKGKLGGTVDKLAGQAAARLCVINLLAQAKAALGKLDRIARVVRLGGFINVEPDYIDVPFVMNGASDLAVEIFGDKGRHARSTVGVASLPLGCAVEVEALFDIDA